MTVRRDGWAKLQRRDKAARRDALAFAVPGTGACHLCGSPIRPGSRAIAGAHAGCHQDAYPELADALHNP
jgi:hypothetical protein